MQTLLTHPGRLTDALPGRILESAALLLCRVSLAGVFWRAGRSKVESGTWLTISDSTRFLFDYEYTGVPLPSELSLYLATYSEHIFPILLIIGLATRFAALALLGMTMTIQLFVYPDAWWTVHSLWAATSMILVAAGAGMFSVDEVVRRFLHKPLRG